MTSKMCCAQINDTSFEGAGFAFSSAAAAAACHFFLSLSLSFAAVVFESPSVAAPPCNCSGTAAGAMIAIINGDNSA
jgi:hypothetical protein